MQKFKFSVNKNIIGIIVIDKRKIKINNSIKIIDSKNHKFLDIKLIITDSEIGKGQFLKIKNSYMIKEIIKPRFVDKKLEKKIDQFGIVNFCEEEGKLNAYCTIFNNDENLSQVSMCINFIRAVSIASKKLHDKNKVKVHIENNNNTFTSICSEVSDIKADSVLHTSAIISTKNIKWDTVSFKKMTADYVYMSGNYHIIFTLKDNSFLNKVFCENIMKQWLQIADNKYCEEMNFSFIYYPPNYIANHMQVSALVYENGVGWTGSCGSAAIAITKSLGLFCGSDDNGAINEVKINFVKGGILHVNCFTYNNYVEVSGSTLILSYDELLEM